MSVDHRSGDQCSHRMRNGDQCNERVKSGDRCSSNIHVRDSDHGSDRLAMDGDQCNYLHGDRCKSKAGNGDRLRHDLRRADR